MLLQSWSNKKTKKGVQKPKRHSENWDLCMIFKILKLKSLYQHKSTLQKTSMTFYQNRHPSLHFTLNAETNFQELILFIEAYFAHEINFELPGIEMHYSLIRPCYRYELIKNIHLQQEPLGCLVVLLDHKLKYWEFLKVNSDWSSPN